MSDGASDDVEIFFVSGWYRAGNVFFILALVGLGMLNPWRDGTFGWVHGLTQLAFGIIWGWGLWQSFYVPVITISAHTITYRSQILGRRQCLAFADLSGIVRQTVEHIALRRCCGETVRVSLLGISKRQKLQIHAAVAQRLSG